MDIQRPRPQPLPIPSANLEMASTALNRSRQGKNGILSSLTRQDDTSSMKIGAVVNCTSGDLLTSTASKGQTSTFNIPESFSNATTLKSDQHADSHSAQVKLPPSTDLSAPLLKNANPNPTPEAISSSLPNCLTYAVRPEALMRATGDDDLWIMLTVPHNGDPPFAEYFRFGYHLSQLVEEPITCLLQ
ncbi:hypothetical protein MCOR25_010413 [Pyricularia grisea]|nr:hypothetical protein MCOR25_010413 [Pyricularia grisea]